MGAAIEHYNRVLDRDDLSPSLRSLMLHQRGYALAVSTNLDREGGFRDLEEAIRLEPTMWEHHRSYALALDSVGRSEEALAHARRAWAIAPSASGVEHMLALFLRSTDRFDEAAPFYAKKCEEDKNQEACATYAEVLHQLEREDEARAVANAADGLEDTAAGTGALAEYWVVAGDNNEAVRLLRRNVALATGGYPLRANFSLTPLRGDPGFEALGAEQWKTAETYWGEQCSTKPGRARCALHALALHLTGREHEARTVAEKAAEMEATATGCQFLAWYHAAARNRDEVLRYLTCRADLGEPRPDIRLGEHVDYEWIRGDPEFQAIAAAISGSQ